MKRALLVIDVQNEYFTGKLPVTYPSGNLDNILKVMSTSEWIKSLEVTDAGKDA